MNLLFVEKPSPTLPILCSCSSEPFPGSLLPWPSPGCSSLSSDTLSLPRFPHPPGHCHPCVPSPVPRDTAPSQLSSASLTPPQRFLQAEYPSQGIEHLSAAAAAANPSCREHLAQRLLLSGFLRGWISPHSPVAGSQRRFVGGIKQFPFICINPNPLAWRRIVGRDGCLEQTCQGLGREKRSWI